MTSIPTAWSDLATWLSHHAVMPLLAALHLSHLAGNPREVAEAVMIAALQVLIIACIFRPLETFAPAERWAGRRLTRVDRHYTLMMLLGIFPLFSYLVLMPISSVFGGDAGPSSAAGISAWMPALAHHPLTLFVVYYVIYDLVYYWMHRLQHALPWWWALHSMHHSQRQMSCWTNDRGSLVDGFIQTMVLAVVGLAIRVGPENFAWLMLLGELTQNFSHTNTRFGFGRVLERAFVDPRFHRLHHMVVDAQRPGLHNCNFGQVLSVWDVLFGTARYGEPVRPTGVGDPRVDADNEHGLIGLHWDTLKRFRASVTCLEGWKLGEVSFDERLKPVRVMHGASDAADARLPVAHQAEDEVSRLNREAA